MTCEYFPHVNRLVVRTFSSETSRDLRLLPTTLNSSSSSTIFLQLWKTKVSARNALFISNHSSKSNIKISKLC